MTSSSWSVKLAHRSVPYPRISPPGGHTNRSAFKDLAHRQPPLHAQQEEAKEMGNRRTTSLQFPRTSAYIVDTLVDSWQQRFPVARYKTRHFLPLTGNQENKVGKGGAIRKEKKIERTRTTTSTTGPRRPGIWAYRHRGRWSFPRRKQTEKKT